MQNLTRRWRYKKLFKLFKGNSDEITRAVSEGFCFQIEVWKSQESFTYFKIFKPISWGKRTAERRCRLIQRFLRNAESP